METRTTRRWVDFSLWLRKRRSRWRTPSSRLGTNESDLERPSKCGRAIALIHNGIDLDEYRKSEAAAALVKHGIDPGKPFLLFVGRITRQKGIVHLVRAIEFMDPGFQIVLCAGAPDTPEIGAEMKEAVEKMKTRRPNLIWIDEMVDKQTVRELYSHAAVFCCPSIYEPFGIINLEAMACETAVVATAVGGIKEVVVDGEMVFCPIDQMEESPFERAIRKVCARLAARTIN